MKSEKLIYLSSEEMNKRRTYLPNEMHRDACLKGASIHKSKKVYSRKDKHKKSYRENW